MIVDTYGNTKQNLTLMNIGEVAINITLYNEFFEELIIELVKRYEVDLIALNSAKIDKKKLKDIAKIVINKGLEGFFANFLKEEDTKAMAKGKEESALIITYFQKGYIKLIPGKDYKECIEWAIEKKIIENKKKTLILKIKSPKCCILF